MLIPVIVATSMAATALGLLVATLVRSESQVSAYATILVITMGGISGCFTPRQWLPDAMREFSLTTPARLVADRLRRTTDEGRPRSADCLRELRDAGRVRRRVLHRRQHPLPHGRIIAVACERTTPAPNSLGSQQVERVEAEAESA